MRTLGLYVHLPFCRSKCLYCDFCSVPRPDADVMRCYTERICEALKERSEDCRDCLVDSVYFGGGTPSMLPPQLLIRMLDTVHAFYHVSADAEITFECNPATGTKEGFAELRRAGFQRVSIGLQSIHQNELRALGRLHSFSDFERTFRCLREVGFENVSVDVMQGIPHQTPESYRETLERLVSLAPTHVSAYALQIEEGTPFERSEARLPLPDEETSRRIYFEGIEFLADCGYEQYEISNFARPGYESRHNMKYWNCDEYLGFGVAAHSFFGGERFGNGRSIEDFLAGKEIECEREKISPKDAENEYVMLRLRLKEGIDVSAFHARYPHSFEELFAPALKKYLPSGLVLATATGYALSEEGMYVSNAILSDVVSFGQ